MAEHNFESLDKFIAYLDAQGKDGLPPEASSIKEAYSVGHRDGKACACRVIADIVRNSNLSTATAPLGEDMLREILREEWLRLSKLHSTSQHKAMIDFLDERVVLAAMTELARRMNGGGK